MLRSTALLIASALVLIAQNEVVKGGVKVDHWGGEKLDQFPWV